MVSLEVLELSSGWTILFWSVKLITQFAMGNIPGACLATRWYIFKVYIVPRRAEMTDYIKYGQLIYFRRLTSREFFVIMVKRER